jgi:hypothetical protein
MNGDERTPDSFSWMRRWSAALNLAITVAAVVAIVAMVNYLAIRRYTRVHWSKDVQSDLSQRTRNVLKALTNDVQVIVYHDSSDPITPRVRGLLKEYELASPRIKVQYVDYLRDGGTAKLIKQQYGLTSVADKDIVIFDANGRRQTVFIRELSDYDTSKLIAGQTNEVYRTHFKGELLFTSSIYTVATDRSPVAYFLVGHGEHPASNGEHPDGYGKFATVLQNENNFKTGILTLGGTNEVPANCNLLIVAGPSQPFDRTELEAIERYLDQGGRMLVLFNSATVLQNRPTGLERLLTRWGVEVGNNIIVDREHSANNSWDVIPVEVGKHNIVNPLQGMRIQMYMPRSVQALRTSRRSSELTVDELLFTGPSSIVVTDPRKIDPTPQGPKPLMAAVERTAPGLQRGATRIVVLGDSSVWNNQFLEAVGNRELAAFSANWLVNQSILLSDIPRRAIRTYKVTLTQTQLRSMQTVLLVGMPGAVLALGALVWLRRRH